MGSLQTQTSIDGGREARHEKAGLFISVDSSLAPPFLIRIGFPPVHSPLTLNSQNSMLLAKICPSVESTTLSPLGIPKPFSRWINLIKLKGSIHEFFCPAYRGGA